MKKKNQCWANNCDAPGVARIKVKLDYPTATLGLEHFACKKHFKSEWKKVVRPSIDKYLKDTSTV